ncbi:MAG: MATE family efflux transporter [Fusobacteriaceae bacterium]
MNIEKNTFENDCMKSLFFKFAFPSIIGMLVVAIQTMIDGIFIANFLGAKGLAAVNLSMPLISFFIGVSLMIASGGAVIAGTYLGDGQKKRADEVTSFTFLTYLGIIGFFSLLFMIFLPQTMEFLGVNEGLVSYVKPYLSTMIFLSLLCNAPIMTETFMRVAGKPNLTFLSGGVCFLGNVIMDYLFIVKFNWGMTGAATATCLANGIGALALIGFFKFEKPRGDRKLLKEILYNGSSEMLTLISSSVTVYTFNLAVMKSIGELGVSALTVVFYMNSLVNISLYGLSSAIQPIISYNLGARKIKNIYEVLKIAILSGGAVGIISFIFLKFYSGPLIDIFSNGDLGLASLTGEVITYFTFAYIFSFLNVISGSFHTAIGKPFESGLISLCKSIVFVVIPLMILPKFLGNIGIWVATPVGEFICLFLSLPLMVKSMKHIKLNAYIY